MFEISSSFWLYGVYRLNSSVLFSAQHAGRPTKIEHLTERAHCKNICWYSGGEFLLNILHNFKLWGEILHWILSVPIFLQNFLNLIIKYNQLGKFWFEFHNTSDFLVVIRSHTFVVYNVHVCVVENTAPEFSNNMIAYVCVFCKCILLLHQPSPGAITWVRQGTPTQCVTSVSIERDWNKKCVSVHI